MHSSHDNRDTAVLVFARDYDHDAKVLGLGRDADRLAHHAVLKRTFHVASAACRQSGTSLVVAGEGALPDVDAADRFEQQGTSFEERFVGAIERTFQLGYRRVVVVGADTPGLVREDIVEAIDLGETVIGPSADGGFFLMSLQAHQLSALEGLPWHTDDVLGALLGRMAGRGERFTLLARRDDLDDARDAHEQHALLARLVRDVCDAELTNGTLVVHSPPSTHIPHSYLRRSPIVVRGPPTCSRT